MNDGNFRQAVMLIQMDFVEMAGLRLTLAQAARLLRCRVETCKAALDALDLLTWTVSPQLTNS